MNVPLNLLYTTDHLWLRSVGRNDIYIGITDFAQKELGRIDSFEIQSEGTAKAKGEAFGKIYGANKTLDLLAPLAGRILMVNVDIERIPHTINSDPYQHWIALISIDNKHFQTVKLLSAAEYKSRVSASKIKL